jgi:hypothetical protein
MGGRSSGRLAALAEQISATVPAGKPTALTCGEAGELPARRSHVERHVSPERPRPDHAEAAAQLPPLLQDGQPLEPAYLVHEASLRLLGAAPDRAWDGRAYFFAAATEAAHRNPLGSARR